MDFNNHVTAERHFDLSRVACCSAGMPALDVRLLAWVYRQETPAGFRLECHVIRLPSATRAHRLALGIRTSFQQAYDQLIRPVAVGVELIETRPSAVSSSTTSEQMNHDDRLNLKTEDSKLWKLQANNDACVELHHSNSNR